jgi:hypothetical protein
MLRLPAFFGMVLLGMAMLVSVGESQDGKKDKEDKKAKGQLPPGFKDLGLSAEQKGRIYSIQADYKAQISELEAKIKALRTKENQDVFKVLTDEQRDKYLKAKGVDPEKKSKEGDKDKGS